MTYRTKADLINALRADPGATVAWIAGRDPEGAGAYYFVPSDRVVPHAAPELRVLARVWQSVQATETVDVLRSTRTAATYRVRPAWTAAEPAPAQAPAQAAEPAPVVGPLPRAEQSLRFYRARVAFRTLRDATSCADAVRYGMAGPRVVARTGEGPTKYGRRWAVSFLAVVPVGGAPMFTGPAVPTLAGRAALRAVATDVGGSPISMVPIRADAEPAPADPIAVDAWQAAAEEHAADVARGEPLAQATIADDAQRAPADPVADPFAEPTKQQLMQAEIRGQIDGMRFADGGEITRPQYATIAEWRAYNDAFTAEGVHRLELLTRAATAPAIVPTVHVLATSGEPGGRAYDRTQTDDNIRDGDVLIVGATIAIMERAWPVAIVGPSGAFHAADATIDGAWIARVDADRARDGYAPVGPIVRRILAGEFRPAA